MKTPILAVLILSLSQFASAGETSAASRKRQITALEREFQQSTDIVIVSPLPSGGYRVVSVIKGSRFLAADSPLSAASLNISKDSQSEHQQAEQLLVWQSGGDQDFVVPLEGTRTFGVLPVSNLGDVTLYSGVKVSLVSLRIKPRLIHSTSQGVQAAPSDGDKPSN